MNSKNFVKVLISTYWNVNSGTTIDEYVTVGGFNLNLLECKYWSWFWILASPRVLISTYWNVNG